LYCTVTTPSRSPHLRDRTVERRLVELANVGANRAAAARCAPDRNWSRARVMPPIGAEFSVVAAA
jgi:hypothetical protein